MRLYRFVCKKELESLRKNGMVLATKPSNRFGDVNTASFEENGIFFSIKEKEGVHHFMMDTVENHYLLVIDMDRKDSRVIEFCNAVYDDVENADYDPECYWCEQPCVELPEVVVRGYSESDVVSIMDMKDIKFQNHGSGYITFSS